jgi:hypothetical protein
MIKIEHLAMKQALAISVFIFCGAHAIAQKIIERYTPQKDSLSIGFEKDEFLPGNDKGYTLILPGDTPAENIAGVLISLEDKRFDLRSNPAQQIYPEATARHFAVVYLSTGIPLDLFFSASSPAYVDTTLKTLFLTYGLPNKNIFFLGVNLSGHRVLKYIEYSKQGNTEFIPDIKGIVLCDGVLDWVRQWYEGKKGIRDNFVQSSVFEGKLVTHLLEKNLDGTPKTRLERYLDFSPYSYFDETDRHIKYFKDYPTRAYTEPATFYWLNQARKTTFDTNFPDMVGFINDLKLAGNTRSELIIFNQDQHTPAKRNPNYTWGLVDKKELMDWIAALAK